MCWLFRDLCLIFENELSKISISPFHYSSSSFRCFHTSNPVINNLITCLPSFRWNSWLECKAVYKCNQFNNNRVNIDIGQAVYSTKGQSTDTCSYRHEILCLSALSHSMTVLYNKDNKWLVMCSPKTMPWFCFTTIWKYWLGKIKPKSVFRSTFVNFLENFTAWHLQSSMAEHFNPAENFTDQTFGIDKHAMLPQLSYLLSFFYHLQDFVSG